MARRDLEAQRGKLTRARFEALVNRLILISREAHVAGITATIMGLEGPLIHAVRSTLCLWGWRFRTADELARAAMAEALQRVLAKRPSWNEGQPDWAISEGLLIERKRCVRCHKKLPDGHKKYCSRLCARSEYMYRTAVMAGAEAAIIGSRQWI